MIRRVNSEGAILFWKAAAMERRYLQEAFDKIGAGHMVPKVDQMFSLKESAKTVSHAMGLDEDFKVTLTPLQAQRDAIAIEARQFKKGLRRNDMPFLFSLGVTKAGNIKMLDVDAVNCPVAAANQADFVAAAQAEYEAATANVDANKVTTAVVALIKKMRGVLLRDGGGVYFVTKEHLAPYEQIGTLLANHGPVLSHVVFQPEMNMGLVQQVSEFFEERLTAHCAEMQAEVKGLYAAGAAPRKNGQARRIHELMEAEKQLKTMAGFFGKPFSKCKSAIQQTRAAIGAEGIKMAK